MGDRAVVSVDPEAERVQMALAEVGYERRIATTPNGVHFVDGPRVPREVLWQASMVAGIADLVCRGCYLATIVASKWHGCLDVGTGSLDCGADRSDW